MSIDRLPPQSIEAEQSVLGALLIDRDAIIELADFLHPADFYRQANGTVYDAIIELYERREPIDIVTVSEVLERKGALEQVGGSAYLTSLINLTPTAVNAVYYGRIVERKAVLRNLIGAAGKIAAIGYDDSADVSESIDRAEQELYSVSDRRVESGFSPLKSLLHSAYDRLDYLHQHKGEISGIRTGFADLDALTSGLQKSDMIVLAARPSVGKTAFALNFAEHASVREGKTVGLFSLEMSKEQLVLRLLSLGRKHRFAATADRVSRGDGLHPACASHERACGGTNLHRRHAEHQHHGAAHQGAPPPGGVRAGYDHRRLPAADAVDGQSRDANRVQEVCEISAVSRRWRASSRSR